MHNFYKYYNDSKKCTYCLRTLEELTSKRYSEKEYVDAFNNMQMYNIVPFKNKKEKKIEVSVLKKDSSSKKYEILLKSVAVSISKNCSSKDKKKTEESIISFFTKTIKTFDNVIYRETKSSKKEDIIYRQYVEQYTIQKIKDYINIFFRKNISRIKNGFENPVKKYQRI